LVVSLSSRNEITLSDLSKFTSIIMSKPPYWRLCRPILGRREAEEDD
jgi:hypothetical protein